VGEHASGTDSDRERALEHKPGKCCLANVLAINWIEPKPGQLVRTAGLFHSDVAGPREGRKEPLLRLASVKLPPLTHNRR